MRFIADSSRPPETIACRRRLLPLGAQPPCHAWRRDPLHERPGGDASAGPRRRQLLHRRDRPRRLRKQSLQARRRA